MSDVLVQKNEMEDKEKSLIWHLKSKELSVVSSRKCHAQSQWFRIQKVTLLISNCAEWANV